MTNRKLVKVHCLGCSKALMVEPSKVKIGGNNCRSCWQKGKKRGPLPLEVRKKMSESSPRFWLGKRQPKESIEKRRVKITGRKLSEEHREKLSKVLIGNKRSLGVKMSLERRKKMSEDRKGSWSHLWRGGITEENNKVRSSFEYRLWREAVFERDNWTCVWCNERGGELNADHIKPFAFFPELRFAIDNGRTLCVPCHKTTNTYGSRILKD